jgi:hypothetical protein
MPTPDTNGVPPFADFEMLKSKINELVQKYNNLLVNLDSLNVVSLTADHIDTGTLDAGKVTVHVDYATGASITIDSNGMTINDGTKDTFHVDINGNVVMTSATVQSAAGYPKVIMDPTGNLFAAYQSATNSLKILSNVAGAPRISMSDGVHSANMTLLSFFGATAFGISADDCNLYLLTDPGFNVVVPDWSQLYSTANAQSLQTALNNLTAAINANTAAIATKATSGASTGSAGSANGGIAPGTVLMVSGGGTVTWNGIPSHSHSQS